MAELITDWYPLPEVAGDHANWEPLVLQPTSLPKSSRSSLLSSSSSVVSHSSTQPQRPSYPPYTGSVPPPRRTSHTHGLSPVPLSLELSPLRLEKYPSTPSLGRGSTSHRQTHASTATQGRHNASGTHPSKLLHSTSSATKPVPSPSPLPPQQVEGQGSQEQPAADLTITSLLSTSGQSDMVTVVDTQPALGGWRGTSRVASEPSGSSLTSLGHGSSTAVSAVASSATLPSRPPSGPGEWGLPVPSLTLTELDLLWRKFLSSSLAEQGVGSRSHHRPGRGEGGDQAATPGTGGLDQSAHQCPVAALSCTCHKASLHRAAPAGVYGARAPTDTRVEGAQISGTQHPRHSTRGNARPEGGRERHPSPAVTHGHHLPPTVTHGHHPSPAVTHGHYLPPTVTHGHYLLPTVTHGHYLPPTVTHGHHLPPNVTHGHYLPPTHTTAHRASHTRAVGSRDCLVQTTPSLLEPRLTPGARQRPAVSFSVARQTTPADSAKVTPTLSQLTLQEALRAFRPEFISRSEQRQRRVREGRGQGWGQQLRPQPVGQPTRSERAPRLFFIDTANCRPKMSQREMYKQSKRHWHRLPEVRLRAEEERRRAEAATNRLRVKLYQKEVLARRRRIRSRRT